MELAPVYFDRRCVIRWTSVIQE